ncbi:MAG: agmatinase [Bacteroidetes bacterium]|nr:MAG: agmatinase [Bacteroidota bacterium]
MNFPPDIRLIGLPWDRSSSYLQGAALAPGRIREALHDGASNYWTEGLVNPIEDPRFRDLGDFPVKEYLEIEQVAENLLSQGIRLLTLGGDHSITYPLMRAHARHFQDFDILQIDAHGDLYDEFEGERYSHACPFARILEEGLCRRLHQVGIRAMNPHQMEQARRFGVQTIDMRAFDRGERPRLTRPLYLSLDLDGLDPAFAPGVSHQEPGGLTSREVLRLLQGIEVPIIGADIVELNPHRDLQHTTAALAAKLLKEIAAKMLGR